MSVSHENGLLLQVNVHSGEVKVSVPHGKNSRADQTAGSLLPAAPTAESFAGRARGSLTTTSTIVRLQASLQNSPTG